MAKTLELQFMTENGKTANITLESPKEPIDPATVKTAMEELIAADVFYTKNGALAAVKGVRVVERNVTEYEI